PFERRSPDDLAAGALQVLQQLVEQDERRLVAKQPRDYVAARRDPPLVVGGHLREQLVPPKLPGKPAPHRSSLLAVPGHLPEDCVELLAVEDGDADRARIW